MAEEIKLKVVVTETYKWKCPACRFTFQIPKDAEKESPKEVKCNNCGAVYQVSR